ncbi:MAG TPA: CDP-alcohol phosphatidyltransferase family protein [Tepidisphaeraceae bacterium]
MFRHIPNALTGTRLVLGVIFFIMLSYYQYEGRGDPTFLNIALLVYVIAVITDYFDGYLARKWSVEGAFGRIVDPFVDKVLVLGSFAFFAGKNFIIQDTIASAAEHVMVVRTISGVPPGVVVILLARELLVTSLRGESEAAGQSFGAKFVGKFKMGVQSTTIFVILIYVNYFRQFQLWGCETPIRYFRNFCIWTTVIVTLYSAWEYLRAGRRLMNRGK